eukprot:g32095.t1
MKQVDSHTVSAAQAKSLMSEQQFEEFYQGFMDYLGEDKGDFPEDPWVVDDDVWSRWLGMSDPSKLAPVPKRQEGGLPSFKKFGLDEESDDDDLGLAKDGDEEEAAKAPISVEVNLARGPQVSVVLLSGRGAWCRADPARTVNELQKEAQQRLGVSIAYLITAVGAKLSETTMTMEEARIGHDDYVQAVVASEAPNCPDPDLSRRSDSESESGSAPALPRNPSMEEADEAEAKSCRDLFDAIEKGAVNAVWHFLRAAAKSVGERNREGRAARSEGWPEGGASHLND